MIVEGGEPRSEEFRNAACDEPVVVQLEISAHEIELQHRGDAIGFLEPDVRDVLQDGLPLCKGAEGRENRKHVGNVAAIDAHTAKLDAVVLHAYGLLVRIVAHRQAHLGNDLHERALGMVGQLSGELVQAAKEHVRRMDRGDGEAERGRADVGRKLDGRRPCLLSRFDLEPAPIRRHAHLQVEGAHHRDGERDVRALVELAFDFDDGRLRRKRREQQQAGDPLREHPRDDDRAAARSPG